MRILVCVKQTVSGELNPFDASAYEAALQIPNAEVILLSMGPEKTYEFLSDLTRLGAVKAYHLCDKAFAGADTLATAYTLSLAVKKLEPTLVICGRQTIDGDTGQTGPSLAMVAGLSLITNVMKIQNTEGLLCCITRNRGEQCVNYPALITVERIHDLRLPSIRSKRGEVIRWNAQELEADVERCGLKGSPTKVLSSFSNEEGKRKCTFVDSAMLDNLIEESLQKERERTRQKLPINTDAEVKLTNVWIVGEACKPMAQWVSDDIRVIDRQLAEDMGSDFVEWLVTQIEQAKPTAVLWGSDSWSKQMAPQVAAILQTGLCADCTALETDGEQLYMYRPAFSGNVIAKITCVTKPQMATLRTQSEDMSDIICALGKGAKDAQTIVEAYVNRKNALGRFRWEIAASRAAVDSDMFPYEKQVGLTGKNVSPSVYLAVGISGAVHHIEGMKQSGTVIAINPDRKASIFEYADYGILAKAEDVFKQ